MADQTHSTAQQPQSTRPHLLTETGAAEYLAVKPNTLAAWRCTKRVEGPRYVKMGGAIRYPLAELDAFIARQMVTA
jgi:predicted DNA-binding transcriptional regulator AlpA